MTLPLSETEAKEVLELACKHGLSCPEGGCSPRMEKSLLGFAADMKKRGAEEMRELAIQTVPGGSICDPQQVADAIRNLKVGE